jgi:group II intron reverse transcriptase/maturase
VKSNKGAAGVDQLDIDTIREYGEELFLQEVEQELRSRHYRSSLVRRVHIPKPGQPGKTRPLGIPTVKDRVVQMAVYLVLMPIFEADFHPHSYGFRPGRSAHQALETIRATLQTGRTEVVDADLAKYFDTIPHRELMRQVARRVSDGMILKLIKAWLRAPILEEEEGGGRSMKANPCGTPQGGVISPLLAKIYLHPLDRAVNDQCGQKYRMVRYADDLVILCPTGQGEEVKERLARWLQAKGLALNEQKTRVLQSRESGFEFLGFALRWQQSRRGHAYVHLRPSRGAEQTLRDRVRLLTLRRTTGRNPHELVQEINQTVRGWAQYFAFGQHNRSFVQMNRFIADRVRRWLWRKHKKPPEQHQRWSEEVLVQQYGLYRLETPWFEPVHP